MRYILTTILALAMNILHAGQCAKPAPDAPQQPSKNKTTAANYDMQNGADTNEDEANEQQQELQKK